MSISDFGVSEADLPTRLKLVNVAPVALVVATVGVLLLAGAPYRPPSPGTFRVNVANLGWPALVAGIVFSALVGLLLQPLELASIRALEGYWRTTGPLGGLAELGTWVHGRRRDRLVWIRHTLRGYPVSEAADREIRNYPIELPLLPTGLGNRLRGMEERAGSPYELDLVDLWPRLYLILPDEVLKKVDNYRNQLDTSCRLCWACLFAAVTTTVILFAAGWWLALPGTFAVLGLVAYRGALHAASNYSVAVCATVDVYRLKLLQAAKIQMPRNSEEEYDLNRRLSVYWARRGLGMQQRVDYSPTDNDFGLLDLNPQHPPARRRPGKRSSRPTSR